jgi:hypothetical protein
MFVMDAVRMSMAAVPAPVKKMPPAMRAKYVAAHNAHLKANPDAAPADAHKAGMAACKDAATAVMATVDDMPEGTPAEFDDLSEDDQAAFVEAHNTYLEENPDASQGDCIQAGVDAVGMDVSTDAQTDSISLSEPMVFDAASVRRTRDGYLVALPRVARVGVQIYAGREVGRPDLEKVRVYRPPGEVFHKDSLRSYAHKPVTNDHPPVPVNAGNWKKYSVGFTGEDVARDGDYIRVPTMLADGATIRALADGKKQLSLGYTTDLKWKSGEANGELYDAVQTKIRANHLAVVTAARGGSELRIGDDDPAWVDEGDSTMDVRLKSLTVDGIECQVTDTSAAIITRHLDATAKQITTLTDDAAKAKATADKVTAEAATAIATKDAEIATLKKQIEDGKVTPAQLDALVKDRATALAKGRAILGDKLVVDGKTISDIQRQVVDSKLGDTAKGWSAEQVAASFNTLTADIKADGTGGSNVYDAARAFGHGQNSQTARDAAYAEYNKTLTDAWRKPAA